MRFLHTTGFIFVVLQAISEIIYLLMDIRELALPVESDEDDGALDVSDTAKLEPGR